MISLRICLCVKIKQVKAQQRMTYESILKVCNGRVHKSQLISILNNGGKGVSLDTIQYVLEKIGVTTRVVFNE